jgi:hypothetical protein
MLTSISTLSRLVGNPKFNWMSAPSLAQTVAVNNAVSVSASVLDIAPFFKHQHEENLVHTFTLLFTTNDPSWPKIHPWIQGSSGRCS